MNKQKELAQNTVILTAGKICTQFISFLLLPLYTALLSPEEFGVVDLFHTYITLLVPLFNWQFENGLFRFMIDCRKDEDKQKSIFTTVIISNIAQSIVYLLLYFILQNYLSSPYKIFLAIDVVVNIILNSMLQMPRGLGNNVIYAIASFISASMTVGLNIVLIVVFHLGAYGLFWAAIIAKIITIFFLLFSLKVWKYFDIRKWDMKILKEISCYSFPLIPNQLSWWIVGVSDRTIISFAINLTANGIYTIANKFSTLFITFYNIFNMSWTESVSVHINDEDRESFLVDTINSMFCLFSAVCFGIIAVMPFAFNILINKQYHDAYYQIPILMIAVLFQVVVGLYSVIYVALKKSIEIAKTSFYAAVINITVDIILIKYIGLYAASISTLAAYALMAVYRYFHVKKYINIALKKKNIIYAILIGILAVVFYYINNIYTNVISLGIVIFYSIRFNKEFIICIVNIVVRIVKEKDRT